MSDCVRRDATWVVYCRLRGRLVAAADAAAADGGDDANTDTGRRYRCCDSPCLVPWYLHARSCAVDTDPATCRSTQPPVLHDRRVTSFDAGRCPRVAVLDAVSRSALSPHARPRRRPAAPSCRRERSFQDTPRTSTLVLTATRLRS